MDELNEINNFNLWEQLSAYVSEYPVVFDKSNKEYYRKGIKRNAFSDMRIFSNCLKHLKRFCCECEHTLF